MRYRLTVMGGHDETREIVARRVGEVDLSSPAAISLGSRNNGVTTDWDVAFTAADEIIGEQMLARWVSEPPREPPYPAGSLLVFEMR